MPRLLCWLILPLLAISGCGGDSPSRLNDLTPLTSIQIVLPRSGIVVNSSLQLQAIGNFSGLFTRDITAEVVWSTDEVVASFAAFPALTGRVQGLSPGSATVTAVSASGPSASVDLSVIDASLASLTVSPVNPTVPKGLSQNFTAAGHFDDGSATGIDQDITFDVVWSSSDPAIATVSPGVTSPGLVAAVAEGVSTISAAPTWSVVTGTSLLTVSPAGLQAISISPGDGAILTLTDRAFSATGEFSDGSTLPITDQVSWSSSNSAVASISTSGLVSGLVQGTTSIRATLNGISASTPLLVTGGNLTNISLLPANPVLRLSTTRRMTATGTFSNGTQRDITRAVTWSVLAPIATISNAGDDSGKLTVSSTGTSTIRAVFAALTAETSLTTHADAINTLTITPSPVQELLPGMSQPLQVTATYSNRPSQTLAEDASWQSTNATVASVDNSGLEKGTIRALASGTTNVSATFNGLTSPTELVTVAPATLVGLTISPLDPSTFAGGSLQMTATADYGADGLRDVTRDVNWSIDDANRAILAHDTFYPGLIYGVSAGATTTIRASFGNQTASTTLSVQ